MKKFIALVVIMLLPLGAFAQSGAKIAFVHASEIYVTMPEFTEVQKKLEAMSKEHMDEIKRLQDDIQNMTQAFLAQQDSLSDNIKTRRMQEIEEKQQRVQQYYQVAEEEMGKSQSEMMAPVNQKLRKAISDVGAEKGYTYIFDASNLLYTGADAIDATPFVKAKLGL